MTITVLIPSYNRAPLLDKALASLTLQTNRDFQVLVVDHASTDQTGEICASYQERLPLIYKRLERGRDAPGQPRHFGMRSVQTPLVVFLDSGIVVPSFFIDAHISFHQRNPRHVGVGPFHGRAVWDERLSLLVEQMEIDRAEDALVQQPELADVRIGNNLETSNVPWMYGWTGNLSLRTQDYWATGGFDQDLEYAFEDVELCYRLFRRGVRFAWVEKGWGLHLPHSRPPTKMLRKMEYLGRERTYRKLRTLGLEVLFYTELSLKNGDATFRYLSEVGRACAGLPSTAPLITRYQFARPSLLLGGTLQDAAYYDYIALANEEIESTPTTWSCSGVHIPLDDQSLQSVIVSDLWKWLGCAFNGRAISLLECMIADIKRTARQAFFIDSPAHLLPRRDHCSVAELTRLCQRYDLPFQVIVPE